LVRGGFSARHRAFLIAGLICAALAFALNTDASFRVEEIPEYQFTFVGVTAWVASIAFVLAAFWQGEKSMAEWYVLIRRRLHEWRGGISIHITWAGIALLAVMVLGVFFYFYRLDVTPAEMTSDHAEKLLDVNDILSGHYPVFFIRNTGREPLQFYLTRLLLALTGLPLSHLALKTGTALVGLLTIPATFLLAREMFDTPVGILAAFFVAVLHWPIAIARMGLRYPFTPFFAGVAFYFFWRALKYQRRNDFLIAGVTLGAGLYGYIPSRDAPFVALGLAALWIIAGGWRQVGDWRALAINLGLMLLLVLVVFTPLLRYSLDYPEMFWYRALTRVTSAESPVQGNVLSIFGQNLANLALGFNWRGDEVWPTNISYDPTLDVVSGALFILGIALALRRTVHERSLAHACLLGAFAALALPSALTLAFPRENPSLVRMGGAIPFAATLIALPVVSLFRSIRKGTAHLRVGKALSIFGVSFLLAPIIVLNYEWYFVRYDESYRLSAQNSTEVAQVIHDFAVSVGDLTHAYFIGYPYWIDGRAIAINLGNIEWHNYTLHASDFLSEPNTNLLFIVHPNDQANLEVLREHYPEGQTKTIHSRTPGKDFISFFVPANPLP
jgi:4-amino-4-deoxy-L-arabinose transferase-like glycosyltransferase